MKFLGTFKGKEIYGNEAAEEALDHFRRIERELLDEILSLKDPQG